MREKLGRAHRQGAHVEEVLDMAGGAGVVSRALAVGVVRVGRRRISNIRVCTSDTTLAMQFSGVDEQRVRPGSRKKVENVDMDVLRMPVETQPRRGLAARNIGVG